MARPADVEHRGSDGDGGEDRAAVAVDAKTIRGARDGDCPAPHQLAAVTHAGGLVLAQHRVAAGHDPARFTFTLDALHTQHGTAQLLTDLGAGYVMNALAASDPTQIADKWGALDEDVTNVRLK